MRSPFGSEDICVTWPRVVAGFDAQVAAGSYQHDLSILQLCKFVVLYRMHSYMKNVCLLRVIDMIFLLWLIVPQFNCKLDKSILPIEEIVL